MAMLLASVSQLLSVYSCRLGAYEIFFLISLRTRMVVVLSVRPIGLT
eukprot:COSAG06_NODE_1448_length_9438_cov_6.747296_4_plen_47_part_00